MQHNRKAYDVKWCDIANKMFALDFVIIRKCTYFVVQINC